MKIPLLFRLLKTVLALFYYLFFSSNAFAQDGYFNNHIGTSDVRIRNANHPQGTHLQNLKRSTGYFVDAVANLGCSCNLLNNVYQDGKKYISIAAHCVKKYNEGDEDLVGYFSFDFEMPNANGRGDIVTDKYISATYKTKYKIESKNHRKDLALLEITDYDPKLFENAYAAGWDNTIGTVDEIYSNIAHSGSDHKKVRINPVKPPSQNSILEQSDLSLRNCYIYRFYNLWNNTYSLFETGSSGSGLFSKKNLLKGVACNGSSVRTNFSHISNIWFGYISGFSTMLEGSIFAQYLDKNNTWLNSVPGGYINDLVPLSNNEKFELIVNPNETLSTPSFVNNTTTLDSDVLRIRPGLFYQFPNTVSEFGTEKLGIKAGSTGNSTLVLSVFYLDKTDNAESYEERLLFGSYKDKYSSFSSFTELSLRGWECDNLPIGFPPCNRIKTTDFFDEFFQNSSLHKNELLRVLKKNGGFEESLAHVEIPIKVSLQNIGPNAVNVQGVSYPGDVFRNALQLFKPDEVASKFKSYKYKPSRGENSGMLYINSIKVELQQYVNVPELAQCVALPRRTLREITTDDNGGYLNLVNPNFIIDDVVASEAGCPKNKLIITLNTNSTSNQHYGAWLDYYKDKKGGNNTNPADDYTYNFVNDTILHPEEQLGVGFASGSTIVVEHEVLLESDLPFDISNEIATHLIQLAELIIVNTLCVFISDLCTTNF